MTQPRRVFVSHTSELARYPSNGASWVDAATRAVIRVGDVPQELRLFAAVDVPPVSLIRQSVLESDVFVAIVGFRYGSVVPGDGRSYVEFEFDMATEAGISRLVILLNDEVVGPRDFFADDEHGNRQMQFRERLLRGSGLTVVRVSSPDQLETALFQALASLSLKQKRPDLSSVVLLGTRSSIDFCMALTQHLSGTAVTRIWPLGASDESGMSRSRLLLAWLRDAELGVVALGQDEGPPHSELSRTNLSPSAWYEIGLAGGVLGLGNVEIIASDSLVLPQSVGQPTLVAHADGLTPGLARSAAEALGPRLRVGESKRQISSSPARYTCFLSYAQADTDFVDQLYVDLQDSGITCWLDRERVSAGQRWRDEIQRGLGRSDKVLLILSDAAARSRWVEMESMQAIGLEKAQSRQVLIPIRIDSGVLSDPPAWVASLASDRQFADFENWRDETAYQRSLRRLVRDITVSFASDTLQVP